MDDSVAPLLGMGIMAVAAISLLNAASAGVHALELDGTGKTGRNVFVFRSDRAQDLRRSFRLFPQAIAWTYVLFVLTIVVSRLSPEAYLDPVFREAFMQSAIVCYALGIVTWMARQSREVFAVIQDPSNTSGS